MLITISDLLWGLVLVAWVGVVTLKLSKFVERLTNNYVARKFIHMAGGGVVAVVSPFVLSSPLVIIVSSYSMAIFLLTRRRTKPLEWFQERDNMGEIFFSLSFGTILLISWVLYPNFWHLGDRHLFVALLPLLFMSFGDGITGIIRNYVYGRRFKGLWGSLGMFLLSAPLGFFLLSVPGFLAGVVATAAELIPFVDDNLTVSFISFLFLLGTVNL